MHMALDTRAWTRADLDRLPDDGNRYEVLDGELLVTPAPSAPQPPPGGSAVQPTSSPVPPPGAPKTTNPGGG